MMADPGRAGPKRTNWTYADLQAELRALHRDPFTDVLAEWLDERPNRDAIRNLADANPEKWVRAIGELARLSGFSDKTEVDHNITVRISEMGDAELLQAIEELKRDVIDITPDAEEVVEEKEKAAEAAFLQWNQDPDS